MVLLYPKTQQHCSYDCCSVVLTWTMLISLGVHYNLVFDVFVSSQLNPSNFIVFFFDPQALFLSLSIHEFWNKREKVDGK
jgi:hypothetical protein